MTSDRKKTRVLAGTILEEEVMLSLAELCQATQVSAERVIELAHAGIVEPIGSSPESWRLRGVSLYRVRCAQRLKNDLGVNMPGVALALDLLDEVERLRARLRRFEP